MQRKEQTNRDIWNHLFSDFIICPTCKRKKLEFDEKEIKCRGCEQKYTYKNGLPFLYSGEFIRKISELKQKEEKFLDLSDMVMKANLEFHNENAEGYDQDIAIEHLLSESGKSLVRDCIRYCKKNTDALVWLDAGCGTGQIMSIAEQLKFPTTIGFDVSESMATIATNKGHIVLLGDAYNIPVEDESVDLVSASALLHHLAEPKKFLEESFRILKSGGMLFTDFDPNNRPCHNRLLIKLLRKAWRKLKPSHKSIHTKDSETIKQSQLADYQMCYNNYFNGESIGIHLRDIGFKDIRIDYYFNKAGLDKPDQPSVSLLLRRMFMAGLKNMFVKKEIAPRFLILAVKPTQ